MVEVMASALEPVLDRPFAFFGHSNGALVAFELKRHLRRRGGSLPRLLIASASPAPPVKRDEPPIHALPDEELIARLRQFDGTSEVIIQNREIMQRLLPVLRADLALRENYAYRKDPPLPIPITAFCGSRDVQAPRDHLAGWRAETTADVRMRTIPGDHFFLNDARVALLPVLARTKRKRASSSRSRGPACR